ncbi:MAG: site-2 protease family protein [bacterium]|nr:site-2 protease family protein [bacterium]
MTLLAFVLVLGTLVFIHELGHFLIAKLTGVYVDCFSLGFGPRVLWFRLGETEYRISLIPLGGFVRMAGQSDLPEEHNKALAERLARVPAHRRYDHQTVPRRMAIIAAGPLMNLIFALPVTYLLLTTGEMQPLPNDATTLGEIVPDSPAMFAGLLPGDRILQVNQIPVRNWHHFSRLTRKNIGKELRLTFERNGRISTATVTPVIDLDKQIIGIGVQPMERAQIAAILSNTPAAASPLQVGDIVDRLIGVRAQDLSRSRLIEEIRARPNTKLVLRVLRLPSVRRLDQTNAPLILHIPITTARAGGIQHVSIIGNVLICNPSAPTNFPIHTGDRVLAAYDRPLAPDEVQDFILAQPAGDLPLTLERITGTFIKHRSTTNVLVPIVDVGMLGVLFEPAQQRVIYPPQAALQHCFQRTLDVVVDTFAALKLMLQRRLGLKALAGPLAIARMTGHAAQAGLDVLLQLVLVITVNLAILNLLPIPILDGGHLALLALEGLLAKPLPPRFLLTVQKFGFFLIVTLLALVMYNDLLRWFADNERLGLFLGNLLDTIRTLSTH